MNELTTDEVRAQGIAMVNMLHRHLSTALAQLADCEGQKAILELRLQAAQSALADKAKADG